MVRVNSLKINLLAITVAVVCLVPTGASAQGTIVVGKVVDAASSNSENGIPNAVVMVKPDANSLLASYRSLTDENGTITPPFNTGAYAGQVVVVKKAGYLTRTIDIADFTGDIALTRDPLENRIDSVMNLMTPADKIGQMTQPEIAASAGPGSNAVTSAASGTSYLYGSVLNGGGGYVSGFFNSMVTTVNGWSRAKIPTSYGKDAVHGNADISGYTVFPHNIGLGASRDSALVRRIGEVTAKQLWAARVDLNFSPAISVARNPRWGRTYESYGETPELSVMMGAAMVRGLQGANCDATWRVTATAKHYLGDGGTTGGRDRGETAITEEELRNIHLPGYEAVVEQGVLSVMTSFNTIKLLGSSAIHQHVDSVRITGWLKTELGFDGYVISDWKGIAHSTDPGFTECDYGDLLCPQPTLTIDAVRMAVNAGVDLAMEPGTHATFITHLTTLVNNGQVSQARVDDAVRRILRAKFRAGRMDNIGGPSEFVGNTNNRASTEFRALAREAAAKTLVLLKNENSALPLSKSANIYVFGSHNNHIGYQCGGWTRGWQGVSSSSGTQYSDLSSIGSTIYQGMQQVAASQTNVSNATSAAGGSDVVVYVIGERPYAEWHGDSSNIVFTPPSADMTNLANYKSQGKKIVTVFISGRPRAVPQLIEASDAFVAAWLPGTEGGGVADVLFGDKEFTGTLPITWPRDNNGAAQFAYGFGLDYNGVISSISHTPRSAPSNAAPRVTVRNRTLIINQSSVDDKSTTRIRLIDVRGKTVARFVGANSVRPLSFSLTKIPAGRYFIEIREGKKRTSVPIMLGGR